jgi:hypothetical protein
VNDILEEVRKILRHLVKIGRSPPGLDPSWFLFFSFPAVG